jgi:hypothetical protein
MMMMRTEQIPECRTVEGAVLAMAMTITIVRVRRTPRAVRKGPGKRSEQRTERGKGKGRGRGRKMVKGKVLLNKPQGKMISLVTLLCSCRRKGMSQTRTQRAT